MMDWFARALGLPSEFIFEDSHGIGGGCLHNSASDAIFSTIVAARHILLKEYGYHDDQEPQYSQADHHPGQILPKFVAYTSQEAHSCVEKACRLALITLRCLRADSSGSLNGTILEAAILDDQQKNLIPMYCCATLGTPSTCAFDHIPSIGVVCAKYNLYLNIDAAYAGNAMICDDKEWLKDGLEYADSIVINPYKMILGAIDLSCLFVRNTKEYQEPYFINATYLLDEFEDERDEELKRNEIDYRHYGIALSRRMRSLKLWFLFRLHGLRGLRQYVINMQFMATTLAGLLKSDGRFEVVNDVKLGLVVFRQIP